MKYKDKNKIAELLIYKHTLCKCLTSVNILESLQWLNSNLFLMSIVSEFHMFRFLKILAYLIVLKENLNRNMIDMLSNPLEKIRKKAGFSI